MRLYIALLVLPYALIIGGLFFGYEAAKTVFTPPEREPAAVSLWSMTRQTPSRNWVKVTGGGHYLAATAYEEFTRRSRFRTNSVETEYYIPLLTNAEALRWHSAGARAPKGTKQVVLVKYSSKDFEKAFPESVTAVQKGHNLLRPGDVQGTRVATLSRAMRTYFGNEWGISPDNIIVIEGNGKPPSPADAYNVLVMSVLAIVGGAIWTYYRHFHIEETPEAPVPPIPATPEEGWFAKTEDEKKVA